jgi:hypothetical protein
MSRWRIDRGQSSRSEEPLHLIYPTVRPELVEGREPGAGGRGFDKLSPNGVRSEFHKPFKTDPSAHRARGAELAAIEVQPLLRDARAAQG